jgi:hypothetical protein
LHAVHVIGVIGSVGGVVVVVLVGGVVVVVVAAMACDGASDFPHEAKSSDTPRTRARAVRHLLRGPARRIHRCTVPACHDAGTVAHHPDGFR